MQNCIAQTTIPGDDLPTAIDGLRQPLLHAIYFAWTNQWPHLGLFLHCVTNDKFVRSSCQRLSQLLCLALRREHTLHRDTYLTRVVESTLGQQGNHRLHIG